MNRLSNSDRVRILAALVEGNTLRSVSRMTGFSVNTVMRFVADFGPLCEEYHDTHVRNIAAKLVFAEAIWGFCYSPKSGKCLPARKRGLPGVESAWTWTARDSTSSLVLSWEVGHCDPACASRFMLDASRRVTDRCELALDGCVYERSVESAVGWLVDLGTLTQAHGVSCDQGLSCSPSKLTSFRAAVATHVMHYNFARVVGSTGLTPAMHAGLAKHAWGMEELVALLDAHERKAIGNEVNKRGQYRTKRAD